MGAARKLRLIKGDTYHVGAYRVPAHDRRYPRKREPRCVVYYPARDCFVGATGPVRSMKAAIKFYGPEAFDLAASLHGATVWRLQ